MSYRLFDCPYCKPPLSLSAQVPKQVHSNHLDEVVTNYRMKPQGRVVLGYCAEAIMYVSERISYPQAQRVRVGCIPFPFPTCYHISLLTFWVHRVLLRDDT